MAWLQLHRRRSGLVCPAGTYLFTKLFNEARQQAGLRESWKPDVLRHNAEYRIMPSRAPSQSRFG